MTPASILRLACAALAATLLSSSPLPAQATCTNVGVERWSVKTAAPIGTRAHHLTIEALAALPDPPDIVAPSDKRLESRYPTAIIPRLHEGVLVEVHGFVQKIRLSTDDCDYHLELTANKDGSGGMVIVEVPEPDADHVADPSLRDLLATVRDTLIIALNLPHPPNANGASIGGRAYMAFRGALFFDGWHSPNCDSRGTTPGASTCWEVHPVVGVRFVKAPGA